MASIIAGLPSPPLSLVKGTQQPLFGTLQKVQVSSIRERRIGIIAKATGEGSESSIFKSVQNVWESEDRVAVIGLGFAGVIGLWASINLVTAIEKLPILPSVLELIGILYSTWFTYRYLLFKPDREEFSRSISKSISDILGQ